MNQKSEMRVDIHPLTQDPTEAWKLMSKTQKFKELAPIHLDKDVKKDAVRFVCMSDTHSNLYRLIHKIPPGDVYIHAGDFTQYGSVREIADFNKFLGTLPHRYKIVIAGNHELCLDKNNTVSFFEENCVNGAERLTEAIYLEDSGCEVYGIRIYGTPWQPKFCSWAFNLPRGEDCLAKWNQIPEDTEILITHTPPIGHGDLCHTGVRAGCVELLATVQKRVKPKYHVFGHIHEGYGITTDEETIFINASTCDTRYNPVNKPIVFDMPLPVGQSKDY